MTEEGLDALVVRAPDNVLYLTNFWGMKGYDAAVFAREGPPVMITIEPSAADAAENAWTSSVGLVPAQSRRSRKSSGCAWRTRSRRRRWSMWQPSSGRA